MLLVAEQHDLSKSGGFCHYALADGCLLRYRVEPHEYAYEDSRIILLLDAVIDHSRGDEVLGWGQKLSEELEAGDSVDRLTLDSYFAVVIDKVRCRIHLLRDSGGVKSGYYGTQAGSLYVGTVVHEVARECRVRHFDDAGIYQLLYLDYLVDGFTYYRDVHEVLIGETVSLDGRGAVLSRHQRLVPFAEEDNAYSFEENVKLLHDKTVAVHMRQASSDNIVLLSGGLDSAVMLISLLEAVPGRVRAMSFRVQGTLEDETVYARSLAEHLGVTCEYITVDPNDEAVYSDFENQLLSMNNPYPGRWIFGNLGRPSLHQTFFAGQDTRLHTPDLNQVDKFAFSMSQIWRRRAGRALMRAAHWTMSGVSGGRWLHSRSRHLRGLSRAAEAFDLDAYLLRYFFHCYPEAAPPGAHSPEHFDAVKELCSVDFTNVGNRRRLYNGIIRLKWRAQYTHDMRYVQDVARLRGTYIAMPFYEPELAEYSSSIPFKQATRVALGRGRYTDERVLINKYVLRMAFRERLNDKVLFRHKAVSRSLHLMCNGRLGRMLNDIFKGDLGRGDSFIHQYNLRQAVERFQTRQQWSASDDPFLLKMHTVAALCLYKQRILAAQPERSIA